MKIFKIKKVIFAVVTAFVLLSTLPFLQSCSNNEPQAQQSNQLEFLDVDVSNLQNMNEEQKLVMSKAKDRIDPYVYYDKSNNEYVLKTSKASEVNMSQRLFDYYKNSICKANSTMKNLSVVVDDKNSKKLQILKQATVSKTVRLKSIAENTNGTETNTSSFDWDYEGYDVNLSTHTLNAIALGSTVGAVGATFIPDPLVTKIVAGGLVITAASAAYLAAEYPNGVVIHQTWLGNAAAVILGPAGVLINTSTTTISSQH